MLYHIRHMLHQLIFFFKRFYLTTVWYVKYFNCSIVSCFRLQFLSWTPFCYIDRVTRLKGKHNTTTNKKTYTHIFKRIFRQNASIKFEITSHANMIKTFHMVSFVSILLIGLLAHSSQALIQNAVGRFPFLMPNVHPYRVSK